MTCRSLALCALLTATLPLAAQTKDLGPASQYYKTNTKFHFVPGTHQTGGEIKWTAKGKVEVEKDEYAILENEVHVDYQDIKLQADKVTVNLKTKDVVAEGHVIIDQGPTRLTADHAVYNLDSKTGTLFKATGTMEPTMYFSGDKIEKLDVDTYRLTEGIFTSCDLDKPAWSFHVREATVTMNDYAHMKDLIFRAHDIPIFWMPRLVWPTKSERSQGVLIPRILRSSVFGERLELGYFIPFGDSADATIYADINSQGYHGLGTSIRYLPNENVKLGELSAYTVRDVTDKDDVKQQWKYTYKHAQDNLPMGFRGVVDVQDFSDLDFFRKYDRDPRIFTLSNIYSSAYLTKNRPTYSLNILADRRDIILGRANFGDPNSPILKQRFEQLPSIQFRMYPQRLFDSPLYFSLESSSSHLRTSGLINGPTADYWRTDLFPTMSMQLRTPPWFSIKPQISVRETIYSSSLSEQSAENPGQPQVAVDEALRRFYAQGQVELVGPSFSKVYNRPFGGFTKFKHVIEPRFRYLYTTNVEDQNRVIRFDTVDSPFLPIVRDSVEYSVTQRVLGKEAGPNGNAREILSFSLRQTASLSKPFTNATAGGIGTTFIGSGKFTPLQANLHVNPYQSITMDANATFGNESHQLDQTSVSANLVGTGKQADKYLSFTWFATMQAPKTTVDTRTSQYRINTGSQLWQDRMRADVQLNFDAKKGTFLEQRFLLGANGSCYGVALEYRRYLVYDPLEHPLSSIGIAVTLKNVGTIGTH